MKTQEWKQDLCSNLFEWELTCEIIPSKEVFNWNYDFQLLGPFNLYSVIGSNWV